MKYKKILRIPIVFAILVSHGINPFSNLIDILPMIRKHLSDNEKRYIINTCISKDASDILHRMIYQ